MSNKFYKVGAAPTPQESLFPRPKQPVDTYDAQFNKLRGSIPLEYLRALIYKESRVNPQANSKGLMQITPVVRRDWNQMHPKRQITAAELLIPETNIEIGLWLLHRIIAAYGATGIPNLIEDWENEEFVRLLTAGWNSGWVGVRNVARALQKRGAPVTHATVMQTWRAKEVAKSGRTNLADSRKERWQREVARLYYNHRGTPPSRTNGDNQDADDTDSSGVAIGPIEVEKTDLETGRSAITGPRMSLATAFGIAVAAAISYLVWGDK